MLGAMPCGRLRPALAILAALSAGGASACGESQPPPGAPVTPAAGEMTECDRLGPATRSAPAGPGSHRPPPFGYNDAAALTGALPPSRVAALHEEVGATRWRVSLDWRHAEPEPDSLELETHDAIYCEALARGIRPIFHVTGAPDWAADDSRSCPLPSCIDPPARSALGELREFAELVARRYPDLAAIEAWNEPNLATFWTEPDPRRYVAVLAAIDEGVDDSGTEIPVLGGALSNTARTSFEAGRYGFVEFLEGMYAAGAARHMDAISFHPYPVEPLPSGEERFTRSMAALRRTQGRNGDGGREIWVTEVGLPVSAEVTPAEQSATLRRIYGRLAAAGDVEAVLFHTLLEGLEAAGSGTGFGWIERGGRGELVPRPAYLELLGGATAW